MAKLPDNETLRRFFREGLSDKEIAKAYDVSVQAVNQRFSKMGLERKPWMNTATAILNAAWPTTDGFKRSEFTHLNRARELFAFMRWRLGDPTLTEKQMYMARRFESQAREGVVLEFAPETKSRWVWVPRQESDGDLVLRWPAGRELPKGPHLAAITLPEVTESVAAREGEATSQ
ncbi:hypothetical protein HKX69_05785 [Streptomyces argyrophyllae]|uniref:Uncharacterized protein n=1 Tax=Streptomyces argyrophylli TaxID=2726118 RepID=A0A6M4PDN2_9ACTN|nr:hypothetical protein [Streptomyces argyrophyllae]QJS09091.1 hypothetical protein HKX69_05785 [Streptomyces argyrophyllae]